MQHVLVAGATGYLGRYLCGEYRARGWHVTALVRNAVKAQGLPADCVIEAEATRPGSLTGIMDRVDLVVSALGITRQADGMSYRKVDYQANLNLLHEGERAGVRRFAYVHVLNAEAMRDVPLVAAKADFVDALQASRLKSTVIAPSGYFSDMGAFLEMARTGRVWLFGTGGVRINPIHGADLASVIADATEADLDWLDVGGPDTLTQVQIAELAFVALGRTPRIICLPDVLRRAALALLPRLTPQHIHGPAQFFLTALAIDMVGAPHGKRHLKTHFSAPASI